MVKCCHANYHSVGICLSSTSDLQRALLLRLYLTGRKTELEYWDPRYRLVPFPADDVAQITSGLMTLNASREPARSKSRIIGGPSQGRAMVSSKRVHAFFTNTLYQISINMKRWGEELEEPEAPELPVFADYVMNSCRLCKEDFESADSLDRHISDDARHKEAAAIFLQGDQRLSVNRAAERRERYGVEVVPPSTEEKSAPPIDWSVSVGGGAADKRAGHRCIHQQGRTAPIKDGLEGGRGFGGIPVGDQRTHPCAQAGQRTRPWSSSRVSAFNTFADILGRDTPP